jgi:hypothetical protein
LRPPGSRAGFRGGRIVVVGLAKVDGGHGVLDATRKPVDQRRGALDRGDRRALAPAGEAADRVLAGVDPAGGADAVGDGLGDELLAGGVELGVVVRAIGAQERVRELVK